MNLLINRPNIIGVIASSTCLIHCLATPLLFMANLCTDSGCDAAPVWWKLADYFFLLIAFFAVYHSTKFTTSKLIAIGLWLSWILLFITILNEITKLFYLPESAIYFPTLSLIFLHLYNKKYCQCSTDTCCVDNTKSI